MTKLDTILRDQRNIDNFFADKPFLHSLSKPADGWIRTVRKALGMTSSQLGKRVIAADGKEGGISGNSALVFERNEAKGTITLNTLQRAADALECDLVYALIPKGSLSSVFERQVDKKMGDVLSQTSTTMSLEDQACDSIYFDRTAFSQELTKKNALWE